MNWQPTCELRWIEYWQMLDGRTGESRQKLQQKWEDHDRITHYSGSDGTPVKNTTPMSGAMLKL